MRTTEQLLAEQRRVAEKETAAIKANLPAATNGNGTAVAIPDNRSSVQQYLDTISPATIAGHMVKFNKDGKFIRTDNDEVIDDETDFVAMPDQTLIGWIKFNGEGQPPDRVMGLLYDGFVMPAREHLGDNDHSKWEVGLDGRPQDPWQHHVYLVLQRADTKELFTFVTSSITGRKAIGNLLRHYDRTQRARDDSYPIVRLKVGGFQHRDARVGWVKTPVIAIVGRAPRSGTPNPDSSIQADMNDDLPF
jgi:hypothetical protein